MKFDLFYKILIYIYIILQFDSVLSSSILCTICNNPLSQTFSIDAWGNKFHSHHEKEGIFCHSCSRIISKSVTNGGYIYHDGRHMCSLCTATAINKNSSILNSYNHVINQLKEVGIIINDKLLNIELSNIQTLQKSAKYLSHSKLKGFTKINLTNTKNKYQIFILSGLPKIEFEAVLAHELLHIWIFQNKVTLNRESEEGFCELGRYLIYTNDGTYFSIIHLKAMDNNQDPIYGLNYHKYKSKLLTIGWEKLILNIMN